ncbi:MAG: KH domain-containing protein [Chloroflexi bacterium]|nr:KH domain-containing protein [Chloroflexota bacterium]
MLELDADREEVEVDVVSKGKAGILGIGGEPAKVRVTRIMDSGGEAGAGLRAVNKIMRLMDVEAQATIRTSGSGPEDPSIIDVQGTDAGLLIGRRGETLQALQIVVNMMVSRELDRRTTVLVDVEQYRVRRQQNLESMAERMAERVVSSGRPMSLEPMSAADRRIIHMALSSNGNVSTESSGEGQDRKLTISPGGSVPDDE